MPQFTIIVPIYNVEKYLDEAILSILNQSYSDFELILVDDGSLDSCPELCDRYAAIDSRIQVIHKVNGGLCSARKEGLKRARGKYVLYVDGDDYIDELLLEKIAIILGQAGDVDIITMGYTNVSENGEKQQTVLNGVVCGRYSTETDLKHIRSSVLCPERKNDFQMNGMICSIWSKVIKREIVEKHQYKVENFLSHGEDIAVVMPIICDCNTIVVSNIVGYYYRQRNNSIVHSFREDDLEKYLYLIQFLLAEAKMIPEQNIYGFATRNTLGHVIASAKYYDNYAEFARHMNDKLCYLTALEECIYKYKMGYKKLFRRVQVFCLKRHIWWFFWLTKCLVKSRK